MQCICSHVGSSEKTLQMSYHKKLPSIFVTTISLDRERSENRSPWRHTDAQGYALSLCSSRLKCVQLNIYWNVTESSTCINPSPDFHVNSVGKILSDGWLIVMVIPRIWHLKMAQKRKTTLFLIIILSCLVTIAAIVRMVRLGHLFRARVTDTPCKRLPMSIYRTKTSAKMF